MSLFDRLEEPSGSKPPESSEPIEYVDVALNLPVDREFQYRVPDGLRGQLALGARVQVPFRNRVATGFCVRFSTDVAHPRVRDVKGIVDDAPLLTDALLALARWIAERYACSLGEALSAVLPPSVRRGQKTRTTTFVRTARPAAEIEEARAGFSGAAASRALILEALLGCPEGIELAELRRRIGCSDSPVRTLERAGLVALEKRPVRRVHLAETSGRTPAPPPVTLDPTQQAALDALIPAMRAGDPRTFLLHGVTGSGKTEVYLRAIRDAVDRGRQAIVLVPEISLTPQTVARFRARFERVAVLHSHLTDAERRGYWEEIRDGNAQVVIGARSAVFAPTPALGLIVIDEEHETSFKQNSTPRYHAREVAVERGRLQRVPVVLGTATPALETYLRADRGEYGLLRMPNRIDDLPMPPVEIVDRTSEPRTHGPPGLIGRRLRNAMTQVLEQKDQILLFLNRRGHSTFLCCTRCGHVVRCERCEITLTYHRARRRASCHYCGFEIPPPTRCPACKGTSLRYLGAGTERIEEEVRDRFPNARVARMDSDTTRARGSVDETLGRFRDGQIDILVGTQMIAKGLDFPDVTLVGIVSPDITLNLPDFRASERTFQLVTQVHRVARHHAEPAGLPRLGTNVPARDAGSSCRPTSR